MPSCLGLYLIINYTIILEDKDYIKASLSLFFIGKNKDCHFTVILEDKDYIKASLSLFFIGKYKDCHFTISLEDNNYNLGK